MDRNIKLEQMLRSLIERGGYSRNRQAILDAVGVTAAALSQYVRGQTRPSFRKLLALAEFFNVSLDYLVYGEPLRQTVDHGPLVKHIEHAIGDAQARASRHSELLTRIGRVLADRVDEVARELAQSGTASREGLIQLDEVLRVERYCLQVDIVTNDLSLDVIAIADSDSVTGQFFQVVAANLSRGCKYRFLLTGELGTHGSAVASFRQLLAAAVGGDHLHENCSFRRSALPIMAGSGLYRLDVSTLAMEEPGLFTQLGKYLRDGRWLGYLNRPNEDSNADMLMSPEHNERACNAFEALWAAGV